MALFDLNSGALTALLGSFVSFQGSQRDADQARISGESAMSVARRNAALEANSLSRKLDLLGRQIRITGASQRAAAGTSGFAVSSKSFLSVMDETLRQFEREVVVSRNVSREKQQSALLEGTIAQVSAENRARATEAQASAGLFSTLGKITGTLLG